jgi:predicted ATP-grasp superfamily ATP-dependent carboligase
LATSYSTGRFAEPIEVLVTDGHTRAGLAVVRSLARHGVSLLVLGAERFSPAFYSRKVKHAAQAPSPASAPQAFVEFALSAIREHKIQLAIPVTDHAALLFDRYRQSFEHHARLAMASSEALRSVLDKRRSLELARQLGVPCPRQFELKAPEQVPQMVETLGFPIVLKQPGDPLDENVPRFDFRVLYAHNEAELHQYLQRYCRSGVYPLFQECALGEVHNLCCLAARGETIAVHEYQSIRRREGTGVLRKVVEPTPELVGYARDLLRALLWDGVAHVAFFVDKPRGKTWFMEINGRFWASLEGSVHAGWDFPVWTYEYFLHGKRPQPGPLQIGSMTCWHLGDLMALVSYWCGGEVPATGANPGKLRSTLQFLGGFHPAIHSETFHWSDPLPALIEKCQWTGRAWKLVRRKVGGR